MLIMSDWIAPIYFSLNHVILTHFWTPCHPLVVFHRTKAFTNPFQFFLHNPYLHGWISGLVSDLAQTIYVLLTTFMNGLTLLPTVIGVYIEVGRGYFRDGLQWARYIILRNVLPWQPTYVPMHYIGTVALCWTHDINSE